MAVIVVGSYVVRFPVGGYLSWVLQWLVGFQRLGHEVYFAEKSDWGCGCFDPSRNITTDDCSYGLEALNSLLARFELQDRWCFVDGAGVYHGLSRNNIESVFRSADLFVDMGSHGSWLPEAEQTGVRVLVDGEPGFRQMKMALSLAEGERLPEYDHYYTVGRNIGTPRSPVPTLGKRWRPIYDVVNVDLFSVAPPPPDAPLTTVMSWQAHAPLRYQGRTYGQKDVEFEHFLDLPRHTEVPLEIAVSGDVPVQRLRDAGWRVRGSIGLTRSFDAFVDYLRASSGEFSVCKNVFVATNSGFFSERSAAYLACGRPVVMQETGFSAHLPCGRGLHAVRDVEEAAAAVREIRGDYERHSQSAREIAGEHLEATKVLAAFLEEVRIPASRAC